MNENTRERARFYILAVLALFSAVVAWKALDIAKLQSNQQQAALAIAADPSIAVDVQLQNGTMYVHISNTSLSNLKNIKVRSSLLVFPLIVGNTFTVCSPFFEKTKTLSNLNIANNAELVFVFTGEFNNIKHTNSVNSNYLGSVIDLLLEFTREIDNQKFSERYQYFKFNDSSIVDFKTIADSLFELSKSSLPLRDIKYRIENFDTNAPVVEFCAKFSTLESPKVKPLEVGKKVALGEALRLDAQGTFRRIIGTAKPALR